MSDPSPTPAAPRRPRRIVVAVVVVVVGLLAVPGAVLAWNAYQANRAWRTIPRVAFDPAAVRESLAATSTTPATTTPPATSPGATTTTTTTLPPDRLAVPDDAMDAYLLVGTDTRARNPAGHADSFLLFLRPAGGDPMLVSLPRNLLVASPCGGERKLKDALEGCGGASGPEVLAVTVEDFTGIPIDHFAVVSLAGVRDLVDRLGGVRLCVPVPMRDRTTGTTFELPAGCSAVDGATAVGWATSRTTEAFRDGVWVAEATTALDRDHRQRDLLLQLLGKLKGFDSVTSLGALAGDLAGTFVLDDTLSLPDAVALAWSLRSLRPEAVHTLTIPTVSASHDGVYVLLPARPFARVLIDAYPPATAWVVPGS